MINVTAAFIVKGGQAAAFEEAVARARPDMLDDPGCLRYDLQRVARSETEYVLIEAYDSDEAIRRHRDLPAYADLGAAIGDLLAVAPVVTVLEPVGKQIQPA